MDWRPGFRGLVFDPEDDLAVTGYCLDNVYIFQAADLDDAWNTNTAITTLPAPFAQNPFGALDVPDLNGPFGIAFFDTLATALEPPADLSASGSWRREAGGDLTFTMTTFNHGPAGATEVEATLTLPAGATFVSATQGDCAGSGEQVTCNLATLANGASATFEIASTASSSGDGIGGRVVVTAASNDFNRSNNTSNTEAFTGQFVQSIQIAIQENITIADDTEQELDVPEVPPPEVVVEIDVQENIGVGDEIDWPYQLIPPGLDVQLGLAPIEINVHETIGVSDETDQRAGLPPGVLRLASRGFFGDILYFRSGILGTLTDDDEEIQVRILPDTRITNPAGEDDEEPDQEDLRRGLRVAVLAAERPFLRPGDAPVAARRVTLIHNQPVIQHLPVVVADAGMLEVVDEDGDLLDLEVGGTRDLQDGDSFVAVVRGRHLQAVVRPVDVVDRLARRGG